MDTLLQDARYGLKQLWKSKGLTIVAIVSLAVGIGANSVIFSVVNSFLLTPRAVSAPEQLVQLYTGDRNQPYQNSSYPTYRDFRDRNEVFSGLAAYGIEQFKLDDGNSVEQVWVSLSPETTSTCSAFPPLQAAHSCPRKTRCRSVIPSW